MASARGMRVLVGGCADIGDGGVPYGPIVEALRAPRPGARRRRARGRGRDGQTGPRPPRPVAQPGHRPGYRHRRPSRCRHACSTRSSACSSGCRRCSPVLFVVEDLHWADPATRETIAFLIRQLAHGSRRPGHDLPGRRAAPPPPAAALAGRARPERARRAGGPRAARSDADGGAPRRHPRRAADAGARRADPSALRRQPLLRRGAPRGRRGRAGGRLPPTLREVLLARIVALPERAQAVIGVAAVAGRRVDHDLLARVAAMDDADLLDALRTAVGSQVLVTGSGRPTAETATTRSATRCSRRRPTTTSCRASASVSIARSPRRSPSAVRAAARSPPGTGRSSPTTGRPHATTAAPSRRRSGRARRPRGRSPSPTRGDTTSVRSSCGQRSTTRRSSPGSIASPCWTGRPSPHGWPATPADRSCSDARPLRRSGRMPTRSGSGRCSSSSVGRSGPTARARRPSRPTRRPWR